MQAVVDATGNAPSLSPLNARRSRFTLPVAGETIIERVVNGLVDIGVERVAIVTDEDSIRTVFGAERGVDRLGLEDVELCFIPHYYGETASKTRGLAEDTGFLWVRGDTLYDWESLAELAEHDSALGYVPHPHTATHGKIQINGDDLRATPGEYTHSGAHLAYAYKFPPRAHEWDYGIDPMTEELATQTDSESVAIRWTPIENPADYLAANLERAAAGGIDVEVDGAATVIGPCVAGEDVTVGPGAVIESSVLMDGATVGAGSYVGHSVVGEGVTIEQNVTTNTRSASCETVVAEFGDERVDTGRTEFGAIFGPGSTAQAGSTVLRGTTVETGLTLEPGSVN